MKYDLTIIEELSTLLKGDLPGYESHQKLMKHRLPVDQLKDKLASARQSAVLLLLYPKEDSWHTVFIERQSYAGVHSAQIAFPGGKVEEQDIDLQETALRESKEELDIEAAHVNIIGNLSPIYIPPSNFLVQPFIGVQNQRPNFNPDPREVASFLEIPIAHFLQDSSLVETKIALSNGLNRRVKAYQWNDAIIWGATSMIVAEFSDLLKQTSEASG